MRKMSDRSFLFCMSNQLKCVENRVGHLFGRGRKTDGCATVLALVDARGFWQLKLGVITENPSEEVV